MPFTQSQLQCLHGMGIVPWVERFREPSDAADMPGGADVSGADAKVQPDAAARLCDAIAAGELGDTDNALQPASVSSSEPPDLLHTPLVEIPFRGKRCTQIGKLDALLLILVEANSTQQSQYPFEPADAKIFEDMLRAIGWRRQDVCLGVLPPSSSPSLFADTDAPLVSDLCQPHRDAVLLFRHSVPETLSLDGVEGVDKLLVPLGRPFYASPLNVSVRRGMY